MATRILCCVNGSVHARRAVEVAVEIAAALGRGLSFLVVNQKRPASGYLPIKTWTGIAARYARSHGVKDV